MKWNIFTKLAEWIFSRPKKMSRDIKKSKRKKYFYDQHFSAREWREKYEVSEKSRKLLEASLEELNENIDKQKLNTDRAIAQGRDYQARVRLYFIPCQSLHRLQEILLSWSSSDVNESC